MAQNPAYPRLVLTALWSLLLLILPAVAQAASLGLCIMTANDNRTLPIFDACKRAGRSIPEDALLVGVGNDGLICDFASVNLTRVDNNRREERVT